MRRGHEYIMIIWIMRIRFRNWPIRPNHRRIRIITGVPLLTESRESARIHVDKGSYSARSFRHIAIDEFPQHG